MRIFYFARIDISTEDAGTRHVFEVCRQFAGMGHEVTLFVPGLGHRREVPGVHLVYVPVGIKYPPFTFFSFYPSLFFLIGYRFFHSRPRMIYTRHQNMEWITTWLRRVLKFQYVIEINGLAGLEMEVNGLPAGWIRINRWLDRLSLPLADKVVVPTPEIRATLAAQYGLDPNRFLVVSNGADPEIFYPMDPEVCRSRLGLEVRGKYLLFVGSFKKWHGLDLIVSAMPEIALRVPGIQLLVVGDGEERPVIEALIAKNHLQKHVTLAGRKNPGEIPVYINAADICLAPFYDDRFNRVRGLSPIKIFEYMACGKPVLTNPVGGLNRLFQTHEIGELVPAPEPEAWAAAIETLFAHPQRMRRYGENGRRAVRESFNWKVISRKILQALEDDPTAK